MFTVDKRNESARVSESQQFLSQTQIVTIPPAIVEKNESGLFDDNFDQPKIGFLSKFYGFR